MSHFITRESQDGELQLGKAILESRGISRKVGDLILLNQISVSLSRDDRIALIGPSGSGKTVFLRALAMLDPIDSGAIYWKGEAVADASIPQFRSQAIYIPQKPALFDGTVEENLKRPFQLRIHQNKQYDRQQTVERLEMLGRDESFLNKGYQNLSGGEAQLTALLRAIQLDPVVLLLDEPTTALDDRTTAAVEALVSNWCNEQKGQRAVIWVTHDHNQAARISDKIWQMEKGKLV